MNERERDLRDLVGNDLSPAEERQLRRVHEKILAAGPLPELPPSLRSAPRLGDLHEAAGAFASLPRRGGRILTLAAAFAVVTLVIGYVIGNHRGGFNADYTVSMRGTSAAPHAIGLVRVGHIDSVGNWPLQVEVAGLKRLPAGRQYALYLTKGNKPVAVCGTFRVHAGQTVVRMNAPYDFRHYDRWIVVAQRPGGQPGPPLLAKSIA